MNSIERCSILPHRLLSQREIVVTVEDLGVFAKRICSYLTGEKKTSLALVYGNMACQTDQRVKGTAPGKTTPTTDHLRPVRPQFMLLIYCLGLQCFHPFFFAGLVSLQKQRGLRSVAPAIDFHSHSNRTVQPENLSISHAI